MNKEENKIWLEKYILNNPFDFKQGIINHCRKLDKIDVYEWVAKDELKIQQLHKRIDKAIEYIESKEYQYGDLEQDAYDYDIGISEIEDILQILKGGNNDRKDN